MGVRPDESPGLQVSYLAQCAKPGDGGALVKLSVQSVRLWQRTGLAVERDRCLGGTAVVAPTRHIVLD